MSAAGEKLFQDIADRVLAPLQAHAIDPRIERLEALAKEAALRVFAASHPQGDRSRNDNLARLAIEAGEAFARAWDARRRRRKAAKRSRK